MYQSAKQLAAPKNSQQRMWRYLSTDRLREILDSLTIHFGRVSRFEDGLEGRLTARSRQRLIDWFIRQGSAPAVALEEVKQYETHSDAFFANCWHMNEHESYLMWRAYAHKGVAISTTFERMQASFSESPGAVSGGVVTYVDFDRDHTGLGQVFTHVTTKDLPYSDEREFRLLVWQHDPKNTVLAFDVDGVAIPVDIGMLVARVVRNPFQPELPRELVSRLAELQIPYDDSNVRARSQS